MKKFGVKKIKRIAKKHNVPMDVAKKYAELKFEHPRLNFRAFKKHQKTGMSIDEAINRVKGKVAQPSAVEAVMVEAEEDMSNLVGGENKSKKWMWIAGAAVIVLFFTPFGKKLMKKIK